MINSHVLTGYHSAASYTVVAFDDLAGPKDGAVAYAFTRVSRPKAGKALVSVGSGDGIRVWLNGRLPGATTDFTVTPFAIVIGTASRDPEMVAMCSQKAGVFAR